MEWILFKNKDSVNNYIFFILWFVIYSLTENKWRCKSPCTWVSVYAYWSYFRNLKNSCVLVLTHIAQKVILIWWDILKYSDTSTENEIAYVDVMDTA